MITLYLVRHGETTFNAEGRIQGHLDAPLSELGICQAEAIAKRLASETFSKIYSSDLARAKVTAEIIATHHDLPVNTTPLLRESNLGIVQGLTRAEIEEQFPEKLNEWRHQSATMRPPGAETKEQVVQRCILFLGIVIQQHSDGEKILVVGHGGSVRGIIVSALRLPIEAYGMMHYSNGSLTILDIGEKPALWLMNDTCHLDSLRTDEEKVDEIAH